MIAACLLLAAAALAALARTYLTGDRLAELVSSRANAAMRGTLRLRAATFRLPAHLELDGVELVDPAGVVRARVEHLEVELTLLPLLRRTVDLSRVDLRGVFVDLSPAAPGGQPALLGATAPRGGGETSTEPSTWVLALADGRVSDLRVVGLPWAPSLAPGSVEVRGARLDSRRGRAALASLVVAMGLTRVEAAGEATRLGSAPQVAGHARARVSLAELASWAPALAASDPAGLVDLEVDVRAGAGTTVVAAHVAGADVRLRGLEVRSIDCGVSFEGEVVKVPSCRVVPAAGGALHLAGRLDPAGLAHDLTLVIERLPVRAVAGSLVAEPLVLPEAVDGRVDLGPPAGAGALGRARIDVEISGLPRVGAVPLPRDARVAGTVGIARDALDPMSLQVFGGTLRALLEGRLPLATSAALGLRVALEERRPIWLGDLAPGLAASRLSVRAQLIGTRDDPAVRGVAALDGVRWRTAPPVTLRVPFRADLREAVITDATLTGAPGHLTARATLSTRLGRTRLVGSAAGVLDLGGLHLAGVGGALEVRARVEGELAALSASLALSSSGLTLPGDVVATFAANAELQRDLVRAKGRLDGGGGSASFEASYALLRRRIDALVEAHALPLEPLATITGFAVAGRLDGRVAVDGALARPGVQAALVVTHARARGVELGDVRLDASGSMDEVGARVSLLGPAGSVALDGALRPSRRELRAHGRARGLAAGRLLAALGVQGHDALVDLDVYAAGPFARPTTLDVAARATHLVIAGSSLADALDLQVHAIGHDSYAAEAALGHGAAASAVVDLRGSPAARGHLAFTELEVDRLVAKLSDLGVAMKTTGEVEAEWTHARGLTGRGKVAALELTVAGSQVRAAAPAAFAYDGAALRLDPLHLVGAHGIDFEIRGVVARDLDVHLGGRLDIGLVAPFVPAIAHASGEVELTARASGSVTAPSVTGELRVAGPVVVRPRTGLREVRLERGSVRATGDARATEVRASLEGNLDGGPFTLEGTATVAGARPQHYDVTVSAQNLPVRTSNLLVEANADLHLTGNGRRSLLAGAVDVVRGRYLEEFELRDFNFVAREPPVKTSLGAEAPWLTRVDLDVKATSESGLNLRVDAGVISMDLQLSSDLHVGGTGADPVVEGRIESTRGTLTFPKAKLDVSQAVVELSPGRGAQPEIDLRADGEVTPPSVGTTSSSTYLVQLRLSGDLRSMALGLSSSPELNRLEVLALLVRGEANLSLVGSSGQSAGGSISGASSSTLDAALAFAGSQITAPLSKFISDQLDKSLNLNLQLGAELTSSGFRLTASQQLTPRLSVQGAYERMLGVPGSTTSARARLLLTDRLFLEGSTMATTNPAADLAGDTSESRLELKWRLLGL